MKVDVYSSEVWEEGELMIDMYRTGVLESLLIKGDEYCGCIFHGRVSLTLFLDKGDLDAFLDLVKEHYCARVHKNWTSHADYLVQHIKRLSERT